MHPQGEIIGNSIELLDISYLQKQCKGTQLEWLTQEQDEYTEKDQEKGEKEKCQCDNCKNKLYYKKISFLQKANRYYLDWALTLAALFHDCGYPLSWDFIKMAAMHNREIAIKWNAAIEGKKADPKLIDEIYEVHSRENFKKRFSEWDKPLQHLEEKLGLFARQGVKSSQKEAFERFLQDFYWNISRSNEVRELVKFDQLDHSYLSAYFLYRIKKFIMEEPLKESVELIDDMRDKLKSSIKEELLERGVVKLKEFYLDATIHAIAFHHLERYLEEDDKDRLRISWKWNPILYLLRLADTFCAFARPEREEMKMRTVKLEGIRLGIERAESDKLYIWAQFDYRHNTLLKEGDKEFLKNDFSEGFRILEKPIWLKKGKASLYLPGKYVSVWNT